VRFDLRRQFISAKTDLPRADEPCQVARVYDRNVDGLPLSILILSDNVSGREQFSGDRSTGIGKMSLFSAPVPGTPLMRNVPS